MSTIDNRVVEMNFDNTKFASGVKGTLSMLDRLKASLHLGGASQGLKDINTAAQQFNSAPMEQGVGRIGGAFTAMQAIAFGALANIGAKVSDIAMRTANAFTIEPITAGFAEYELKMGSIQTILANTARHGTELPQVNAALEELNHYADKTIYNFGDMTKNIGLFTNAGLKVEEATSMIKGFSNEAAASGTSAEGAAGAAYQLSQALSAGQIRLMDWRSLTNVGMGNKNMQLGIIELAESMGTLGKAGVSASTIQKDFNGSLEKGWLTSEVMSKYLQIQAGDMNKAEMAALGLSDAQIKAFLKTQKTAEEAATKVRTFSGLMGTLKEAVGSGWAETFGIVLGDFNEATDLFTNINDVVGGALGNMSKSRNDLLKTWADNGGRQAAIGALADAFSNLGRIVTPLIGAFRKVFPRSSAKDLLDITYAIRNFVQSLKPSEETMKLLYRTFAGFFAILGIGWEIVKAGVGFLFDLFGVFFKGDAGILKTTASIGDFLVGLHKAIKDGQGLTKFFDKVVSAIEPVVAALKRVGSFIGDIFQGIDIGGAGAGLGEVISNLLSFGDAAEKTAEAGESLMDRLDKVLEFFANIGRAVANFMEPVTSTISDAIGNIDYDQLMQGLQTGALAGIAIFIKQLGGMFKGFSLFQNDFGFVDRIKEGLDNLTGTLSAMQANLKASMLLKIAAAIALLAVSVVLLAGVDAVGLARATGALTVMFVQLGVAMAVFQKIGTIASMVKLNLMGAALILVAGAVLILAAALRVLSKMSWSEIARGMTALAGIITVLIIASRGIDKQRGAILRSAASLIILGFAIKNLIGPIKTLGSMDWDVLRQGLIGVGGLLAGLALFTRLAAANKGGLAQSAGILILAFALKELSTAVLSFGTMSVETLQKGFGAIATGLTIMAAALWAMPKSPMVILTALALSKVAESLVGMAMAFKKMEDIGWESIAKGMVGMTGIFALITAAIAVGKRVNPVQSAALFIVASAIAILGRSLIQLSALDYDEIARGLLGMGGALILMAAALRIMGDKAAIAGSIGMMAMAVALSILIPVIITLGNTPLEVIAIGLGALAGVFIVLGVAAWALAPVVPVLQGLGIAIILIGGAMALAGAGTLLFAMGLTALAAAGTAGVAALVAIVSGLIGLIPMVAEQIGKGIVALLVAIGNSADALVVAVVQILGALLDAIVKIAPKLGTTLLVLIRTGLRVLVTAIPQFVDAGMKIIIGLLRGIANNIGQMVDAAVDIIVNFVNGITRNLPKLIQAGFDMIIALMNGIGDAARENGKALGEAGGNMATGIIEGIIEGLKGLGGQLIDMFVGMLGNMWDAGLDWLGIASPSKRYMLMGKYIMQGLAKGLTGNRGEVQSAFDDIRKTLSTTIEESKDQIREILKRRAEIRKAGYGTGHKEYDALTKQLAKLRRETDAATRARSHLVKNLDDERDRLKKLADQYDANAVKLEAATQQLADARKVRDDYNKSIRDQYGEMEDISADTKLDSYITNLEKQILETQAFTTKIQELRRQGLNDELYKELLAQGPQAMPFIDELLSGGQIKIDQLNTLTKTLDRDAELLADKSSAALYQAGVNAAEGLVRGLEAQQKSLEELMGRIADFMVNSIKSKLGIKSPSRVFAEIGEQTNEGLVRGLNRTASAVGQSTEAIGDEAISSLRNSLSKVTKIIGSDMDVSPVISPILDLSDVRKNAAGIGSLLGASPLTVDVAYSGASNAFSGYVRNRAEASEPSEVREGDTIIFEQHNNSPKALSAIEIYRQTNNVLSVAKGALTRNAR